MIPFGEWLPDQPSSQSSIVRNALPFATSYGPVKDLVTTTNALDSACLGSFWAKEDDDSIRSFAGDATKLYLLSASTYANVSKSGNYSTSSWEFTKFGERIIAVGPGVTPQYYDMGTSSLFADLTGAPAAKHIAVVQGFVVLGRLDSGVDTIKWSGFNNSDLWTPNPSTQSGEQDLLGDGGRIQKIVGGDVGVIFQEHAIRLLTPAGPPFIQRIDNVLPSQGTPASGSVCRRGRDIYYLGHDGFYMLNVSQGGPQPIGSEKVDRYISKNIDRTRYDEISSAVDRQNRLVFWSIPFLTGKRLIVYSWAVNKFAEIDIDCDCLGEFASSGYTIAQLGTLFATIGDADIAIGSDALQGGAIAVSAFKDNKLATFSGSPLTATLETGELSGRQMINRIRPIVEGAGDIKLRVGTRNRQTETITYSMDKNMVSNGDFTHRSNAHHTKFQIDIIGGFDHAEGVELISGRQGGYR